MGPTDIELVRAFTTETSGIVADVTFQAGTACEVIIEAEAGSSYVPPATPNFTFTINVVVRDLTTGQIITSNPTPVGIAPAIGVATTFTNVSWPSAKQQFRYTIGAGDTAGRGNHCCDILSVLTVTPTVGPDFTPDVSFVNSPMFLITP